MKTYSELITLDTYDERLSYLSLLGSPHTSPRSISLEFYKHPLWIQTRKDIVKRDLGCDLGVLGVYINGKIYVHHINPITEYDIVNWTDKLLDPDNLISTSDQTHKYIHYGQPPEPYEERTVGDTTLWGGVEWSKYQF